MRDYSQMTPDELVSAAEKTKSQRLLVALLIGFLVGMAIWSATHGGGFLMTTGLLIAAGLIGSRYTRKVKSLQAEINRRNTAP